MIQATIMQLVMQKTCYNVAQLRQYNNKNIQLGNFAADIVLVVLKTTIEFKSYVTPICIPYGLKFDDLVVPAGWRGNNNNKK